MTTAVIYCRISKDPEGRQAGVDRQEAECRSLAARLGLEVGQVYIDNDLSASTLSRKRRPAYEQMMAAAEAGRVPVILAYSNSRLTRRPLELERLITTHDRTGVQFRTVVSGDDNLSTADGRMTARIKASVDAAESERISERTRGAKTQARDAGAWLGGWRPYGFEPDGRTPRQAEADVIVEASQALLAGTSLTSLVRKLNARGEPTSTGGKWSTRSLCRTLIRPHPSVDEDTTAAVRDLLADPTRRTTPGPARRWLLSGLAVCNECRDPLRGSGSSLGTGRGTYPAYRCRTGKHVVVNAVVLDEFIEAIVVERLKRSDVADLLAAPGVDTAAIRARLTALRTRLDALADNLDIDEQTLARRSRALNAEITGLEEQRADAARASPLAAFVGRDPVTVWRGLDLDRRRAVIDALMTVVVRRVARRGVVPMADRWREDLPSFDPERIEIVWRTA